MITLEGGVAVVTGAAGGIGRALAMALTREGMSTVVSDLDAERLATVSDQIRQDGGVCEAIVTDVTDDAAVAVLADRTRSLFGDVTVVCSNAGVMVPGAVWEVTPAHWGATLDVNVTGAVNLARNFIPDMIASGRSGRFLCTVGLIGLFTSAFSPPGSYAVSKHAALAFAEVMHEELATIGAPIGVTALMPGGVRTGFAADPGSADGETVKGEDVWPLMERLRSSINGGMDPDDVARAAIEAVKDEQFWVFTHPDGMARVKRRFEYVLAHRPPTSPYGPAGPEPHGGRRSGGVHDDG